MMTIFAFVMIILSGIVIFGCIEQKRVPASILEWVIIVVTALLLVMPKGG